MSANKSYYNNTLYENIPQPIRYDGAGATDNGSRDILESIYKGCICNYSSEYGR